MPRSEKHETTKSGISFSISLTGKKIKRFQFSGKLKIRWKSRKTENEYDKEDGWSQKLAPGEHWHTDEPLTRPVERGREEINCSMRKHKADIATTDFTDFFKQGNSI